MKKKESISKGKQQVRIGIEIHKRLKDFSKKNGVELYAMIERCLNRALQNNSKMFLP